jgi:hypothetical protein
VRLIPAQYVELFLKGSKNISEEQRDLLSLHRVRLSLVRQRAAVMHQLGPCLQAPLFEAATIPTRRYVAPHSWDNTFCRSVPPASI